MSYPSVRSSSTLIGVGVVAFGLLQLVPQPPAEAAPPAWASPTSLVVLGVGIQLALLFFGRGLSRRTPDRKAPGQGAMLVELLADGVTVLLFALGTLGPIWRITGSL